MANLAPSHDLRSLLSLAQKLRALAKETQAQGDQLIYLMAAEALEQRAERLPPALPDPHHRQEQEITWHHRPVDLFV